jgi:hypothetical protein
VSLCPEGSWGVKARAEARETGQVCVRVSSYVCARECVSLYVFAYRHVVSVLVVDTHTHTHITHTHTRGH